MLAIPFDTHIPTAAERAAWQEAMTAAETHVKLGKALQSQGAAFINALANIDAPKDRAVLLQQATAAIDKGTAIESRARLNILKLLERQPEEQPHE